jgi:hypothetical protein
VVSPHTPRHPDRAPRAREAELAVAIAAGQPASTPRHTVARSIRFSWQTSAFGMLTHAL